jgi:hypothetical protein
LIPQWSGRGSAPRGKNPPPSRAFGQYLCCRGRATDKDVVIFAAISTCAASRTILFAARARRVHVGKGVFPMKRIGSHLRSATSRIVRQLAQIADIAAASLPSVGA